MNSSAQNRIGWIVNIQANSLNILKILQNRSLRIFGPKGSSKVMGQFWFWIAGCCHSNTGVWQNLCGFICILRCNTFRPRMGTDFGQSLSSKILGVYRTLISPFSEFPIFVRFRPFPACHQFGQPILEALDFLDFELHAPNHNKYTNHRFDQRPPTT